MKLEDITTGTFPVGKFSLVISSPVFQTETPELNFFELHITEDVEGWQTYIHLHTDERFLWFQHLSEFARRLLLEDLVEYNSYQLRQKLVQPTWLLSRASLVSIFEKCQALSKKKKK